jgi:hypothetical protein
VGCLLKLLNLLTDAPRAKFLDSNKFLCLRIFVKSLARPASAADGTWIYQAATQRAKHGDTNLLYYLSMKSPVSASCALQLLTAR